MANVKLLNMKGEEVGSLKISDKVFKAEINPPLVHQSVVARLANERQGTKSTLTRSEVRGHAKKPYKQKHTGNARQGSTKGPHQTGGGVAFAPKPRDFSKKINKVAKKVALASALSSRFEDKDIIFMDEFKFEEPKTKLAQAFINNLKLDRNVLIVMANKDSNTVLATSNIPSIQLELANKLSVYDVVKFSKIILTKDAVKTIEEGYAEWKHKK